MENPWGLCLRDLQNLLVVYCLRIYSLSSILLAIFPSAKTLPALFTGNYHWSEIVDWLYYAQFEKLMDNLMYAFIKQNPSFLREIEK